MGFIKNYSVVSVENNPPKAAETAFTEAQGQPVEIVRFLNTNKKTSPLLESCIVGDLSAN